MARTTWTIETADGPRRIEVTYGFWLGWLRVRVDDVVVRSQPGLVEMGRERGIDAAVPVGAQQVLISVRPNNPWFVTAYRFAVRLDGAVVGGDGNIRPLSRPSWARSNVGDRWPGSQVRRSLPGADPPLAELHSWWPTMSRAFIWFGIGAFAWFFVCAFAVDEGLQALGFLRTERPMLVRQAHIGLMLAPGALWLLSPLLGRFRPFRWTWASPQPGVRVQWNGLEVRLPGHGTGWFTWDEIGGLVTGRSMWGYIFGDLVAPDGAFLVRLPQPVLHVDQGFASTRSLALAVVHARPDRYVLTSATWDGYPSGFGLHGAATQTSQSGEERLSAWTRRRRLVTVVIVIIAVPVILLSLFGSRLAWP